MQIVRTYFLSRVKKLSLQHICRTKPTSYIMLIALLPILLIICAILLLSYLWERRKCLRMQKRLFRESRKLEHTNHIASAILKNVHAYILLIDNDFKVLKTNYYQLTGTQKGLEEKRVGDLLQCRNALSAEGGCGTHAYCASRSTKSSPRNSTDEDRFVRKSAPNAVVAKRALFRPYAFGPPLEGGFLVCSAGASFLFGRIVCRAV